jgi:hypothetical protein
MRPFAAVLAAMAAALSGWAVAAETPDIHPRLHATPIEAPGPSTFYKVSETRLAYEHIYLKPWHPEREDALRFLRVVMQGWSKEDAVREMTSEHSGFHRVWRNLLDWIEELDVESMRRDAGILPAPE